MTFNQNGERQQTVHKDVFLAEQYPSGTISFFQAFVGIPYTMHMWQEYIELPVTEEKALAKEPALIIAHDFTNFQAGETATKFYGWPTLVETNGEDIPAIEGDGFDFVTDNVPSSANFADPQLNGQLQASNTDWDVTCPAPKSSLMYLGGQYSFDISVLVGKTETYTVEFWFKANVTEFAGVSQDRTFLFMMNGRREGISKQEAELYYTTNVMAIYVENNELKCAPFGFVNGT